MPDRLVHIVDDVPELDDAPALTMVVVLDGFLDAGNASGRAAQHLVDLSDGRVVATFDVDELHDYRARRPPMSFVRDHYASYDAPRLVVRLLGDLPVVRRAERLDDLGDALRLLLGDLVVRLADELHEAQQRELLVVIEIPKLHDSLSPSAVRGVSA